MAISTSGVLLVLTTFIFPPLGVYALTGFCGVDFLANVLLTILGYIPGEIHAFYIIYVFYQRRHTIRFDSDGYENTTEAPIIYSREVQGAGNGARIRIFEREDKSKVKAESIPMRP